MKIIGISGLAGSGKNTIADILRDQLTIDGKHCAIMQYGDAVRREIVIYFDAPNIHEETKDFVVPTDINTSIDFFQGLKTNDIETTLKTKELGSVNKDKLAKLFWLLNLKEIPDISSWTWRQVLQFWGTNFRRGQDNYYWVELTQSIISGLVNIDYVLIPDVRFKNEVDILDDLIYVKRKGLKSNDNHVSETNIKFLKKCATITIKNNGDLDLLKRKVSKVDVT